MKNNTFLSLVVMCCIGFMSACNDNQTTVKSGADSSREIAYNDKIQNEFYGVSFGASRKELVDGFKSQGFYEASNSTATEMTFYLAGIKPFEFGDMSWEVMYVSFANKHFYSIQFVKKFDTMEQAISEFNSIQSKLSSKYMMTEEPSSDPNSYKSMVGRTKNKQFVVLECYRNDEGAKFVSLGYMDKNYYVVSDEL